MNKYQLICRYCDFSWEINYDPTQAVFCLKCQDSDIRIRDIRTAKIDTYIGCPPFPEKVVPKEEEREDLKQKDFEHSQGYNWRSSWNMGQD